MYAAKNASGFGEGDLVEFAGELNRIAAVFDNVITFEQDFEGDPVDTSLIPKALLYSVEMDVTVRCDGEVETYSGCTLNPTSSTYLADRLRTSRIIVVDSLDPAEGIVNPVSAIFGEGKLSGSIALSGGSDGTMDAVNAGVFIGQDMGPGKRTGIC